MSQPDPNINLRREFVLGGERCQFDKTAENQFQAWLDRWRESGRPDLTAQIWMRPSLLSGQELINAAKIYEALTGKKPR